MRTTLLPDGVTIVALVTVGLVVSSSAKHGRNHGSIFDSITHKSTASSGSSLNVTAMVAAATVPTVIPESLSSLMSSARPGTDCGPLNATVLSPMNTHIAPVSEAPQPTLKIDMIDPRHTATRRTRVRPTQVSSAKSMLDSVKKGAASLVGVLSDSNSADDTAHAEIKRAEKSRDVPASKVIAPRQDDSYQSFVLGPYPQPTSSSPPPSATASSVCPHGNLTTYTSAANIQYQIVCDIDFPNDDYPFQLVTSFEACIQKCDAYNYDHHHVQCLAALFVPNREADADDCYLKSSTSNPTASSIGVQGAVRLSGVKIASASSGISSRVSSSASRSNVETSSLSAIASPSTLLPFPAASSQSSNPVASDAPSGSASGVTYASGKSVIFPMVAANHLHGPAQNTPSQQVVDYKAPVEKPLMQSLLKVGVNGDLSTGYDVSLQTGILEVNISTQSMLSPLNQKPHISRDGGRGGFVNGQHLFVFCDTGSYTQPTVSAQGKFLGFVSSSVAIDTGMNGLFGKSLNLQDGIGEWSDDNGRMRGFAPLTEGENAYNQKMQGQGQRYAIWPESSIIPLDAKTGIIYAPIVYDNVNMQTKAAVFTYTGATLLTITTGGKGGPYAERTVPKLFNQDQIEWGCAGGIRSWGPSGIGGDDGSVYIFGGIDGGILLARTSPLNVGDVKSYQYWDGKSWTNQMLSKSSTAFFIKGPMMDIDVFYSPRHLTFIIVYLSVYADSTFYYRYLRADQGILPPFAPGGDKNSDYVENILKYSWSEQEVLYKASPGLGGRYVYSGGVHQGYYGSNDITNGGSKMLLSWTAPTSEDPSSMNSEYQIVTAEIDWA